MTGAVVSVGDELVQGLIRDTNAPFIEGRLLEMGFRPCLGVAVGDQMEDICQVLGLATMKARVVVVCGGLGPTEDDVTREAVARFCHLPLEFHPGAWKWIHDRLTARGRTPLPEHRRQAYFPRGATLFPNRRGTAWGFAVGYEDRWIVVLPGVPLEMENMLEGEVIPFLRDRFPRVQPGCLKVLKTFGLKESQVNALLQDLLRVHRSLLGVMVREYGEVHVRICGPLREVEALARKVRERLGDYLYGQGEETLEGVVGSLLKARGFTMATAESCTGGMLAHTITNVPGSSEYFLGGLVTYTNGMKRDLLGVPADVLENYTAVSMETARAMVEGVVERTGADVAVSVTGIAGPTGGTPDKPVGLVYIGYRFPWATEVEEHCFQADRLGVKTLAVKNALDHIRRSLTQER